MDGLLFVIILALVFFFGIIPALLYWIPLKLGYHRVGIALLAAYSLCLIYVIFEDSFFFKSDAKKFLTEQNIELLDDFEIIKNESFTGFGDYYHTFILEISERDKKNIINEIKNAQNFGEFKPNFGSALNTNERYFGKKVFQNYESIGTFIREFFEPSNIQGYAPNFRRIRINPNENRLIFEDIEY